MGNYKKEDLKLALRVTLHCVMGCGVGDTVGLIIGTILKWSVLPTMILGVVLGFIGGYTLTMIPLLKKKIDFGSATKITIASETASILVMETAENVTASLIPGLLIASFLNPLFWFGFFISVLAGFVAAYPVNYFMISKGLKGGHFHH